MEPETQTPTPPPTPGSPVGVAARILAPLGILFLGWLAFELLSVEKESEKHPPPQGRVLKTKVLELRRGDFQTTIRTQGVVRPHNEASLTPQVSGKVKSVGGGLHDGAFFEEGEVLLELDDEDFEAEVTSAEAALARAVALHAQEQAKANQARLNWVELGYEEEPNELVLRLPQLREAEANVKAATASLERARRDLGRTVIRAPFAGRVLDRAVSVGQSVSPSTVLATVFNTAFVEVRLPVAARELAFLSLPEGAGEPAVTVELSDALDEGSGARWTGKIIGTEGALDQDSRELFAIARVDDPFSRTLPAADRKAPLRVGQPVRAAIPGKVLQDVYTVPRDAVRQLRLIYLVDREELTLERREIEEVWSDAEHVIIHAPDIPDGSWLATSRLVYAPNVSKVEILEDAADPGGEAEDLAGSEPDPPAG